MKQLLLRLHIVHVLFAFVDRLHLQTALRVILNLFRHHSRNAHLLVVLPRVLNRIPASEAHGSPATWSLAHVADTVTDITVAFVGPWQAAPTAVVKLTRSDEGRHSLLQRSQTLADLHADVRLGEWHSLIPQPLASGEVDGHAYQVQSVVDGVEVWPLLANPNVRHNVQLWAAKFTGDLARRTGTPARIDEMFLAEWIDEPCAVLRDALHDSGCMNAPRARQVTERLARELRPSLAGRTVTLAWTHGDLMPGNILVSPDGRHVCGLVDWELARPDGLPFLDLLFLCLSVRMAVERRELGDVMRDLLGGTSWSPQEDALLERARSEQLDDEIDLRSLLLLCWLQHVAANLRKSGRYAHHTFWLIRNVEFVLNFLYPSPRRWLSRAALQGKTAADALPVTPSTPL